MVGPRVYEIEEVNELIPDLQRIFAELGELRSKLRTLKVRVDALELIWGDALHESDNPDHGELQSHLGDIRSIQQEFERASQRIAALGGQVKKLEPPLVDFFGVREGRLVHWCWAGGEEAIGYWHHIDEGFAGRQPV